MNKYPLNIVKENEYAKPFIHKIDSVIDNCIRDFHTRYFHSFENECAYDVQLTISRNIEIFSLKHSDKSMGLYELNKKLKTARQRGFSFNQINKLTMKIY